MEPGVEVATALHTAINFDTHQFTRNVHPLDMETVAMLYQVSNVALVNSLVRNSIKLNDFKYYHYLIDNIRIEKFFAYCHFPQGCNKDLLAILADYILSVEEIKFVVLSTQLTDEISFCVRSENLNIQANTAIQTILEGIGSGGGHIDMAGGRIPDVKDFDQEKIFKKCLKIAKSGC